MCTYGAEPVEWNYNSYFCWDSQLRLQNNTTWEAFSCVTQKSCLLHTLMISTYIRIMPLSNSVQENGSGDHTEANGSRCHMTPAPQCPLLNGEENPCFPLGDLRSSHLISFAYQIASLYV